MGIYKVLNSKFQVICYQFGNCRADAIVAAKAEGFTEAQHCEFVKLADSASDDNYI